MPFIHNKTGIMRRTQIAVTSNGDMVGIQIGNGKIEMHYEDALKFSQWIRVRAKEAKRAAGDTSRHWSAIASIEGVME